LFVTQNGNTAVGLLTKAEFLFWNVPKCHDIILNKLAPALLSVGSLRRK
jgi:hypothetical protein